MITEALVPGSATVYQMENLNKARLLGGELDVQYRPFGLWQLYANIAYTRGTNETDNTDLSFIPPLNGLAGMGYNKNSPGLWGDINLTWAAHQNKVSSEETRTPGWATVNLKAGYRFLIGKTHHDLVLGIDNLLDKAYANHLSTSRGVELSEPGFNAYLAWKMTF
ncbi:MAG: TonB-dependent receptor [Desulfobacter sp.]|nr:TonB-dependent receptor [Desulfobacter sp.]WDP87991.1 MAG: TonB-dependent receptor [Desulfobacter sp.]